MTNLTAIIKDIKETATPLMNKWVNDRTAYVMNLKDVQKALDTDEEFVAEYATYRARDRYLSRSTFKFIKLQGKGYTKGDIMLASYESEASIRIKMKKDADHKLAKIDVAVAKKINFDVKSVEKLYLDEGKDGFIEGAWKLNGEKIFSFDTIYAGGYNIQCLHVRTKYKLK
jgi:hypothetical protein|tara:strand:- start:1042 stop:1554 length:513 start_codon:yes stop_codon:yes gene_type:complete